MFIGTTLMDEEMKVFPNGEKGAVEWLAESGFLDMGLDPSLSGKWLKHVGLCRQIIPCCDSYLEPIGLNETEIRNYVKAFEVDYISLRGISYPGMPPPFCEESPTRIFAGVEAKYFYASNLNNEKYHTGVGQLVEYLKWGLDIATLVHIFDSDLGKTKINEFRKPTFRLISGLRDACHLPLGYVCLIVDENKNLNSCWDHENSCWSFMESLSRNGKTFSEKDRITVQGIGYLRKITA